MDAVQRVDGDRSQINLWHKMYSSPLTKAKVLTFDGDKASCRQQVAAF
jgi:hypothetical protein